MTDEQPDESPDATTDTEQDRSDSVLGEAGEKAFKAERARANKLERDFKSLQAAFDANIAEASTTRAALEKVQNEAAAQLTAKDLELTKYRIGVTKGLDETLIKRLQGSDEAAIAADADELMRYIPNPSPTNHNPRPDPSQGAKKPATSGPLDAFVAAMGPILNP